MSSLSWLSTLINRPVSTILDAAGTLVDLPRRVMTMVIEVEQTLAAVNAATQRADALIERIDGITTKAEDAVRAASDTVGAAAAAIEQARTIAAIAAPLLDSYSEPLRRLEPAVRRLAETTDSHEVDALVKLIDRLPRLVNAMDDDVMPLLDRLDRTGPDLNQLLDNVSDLNRMAGRIPKVFRRRREDAPRQS
jgi:ABC-type transporter Mla subunit MlaD